MGSGTPLSSSAVWSTSLDAACRERRPAPRPLDSRCRCADEGNGGGREEGGRGRGRARGERRSAPHPLGSRCRSDDVSVEVEGGRGQRTCREPAGHYPHNVLIKFRQPVIQSHQPHPCFCPLPFPSPLRTPSPSPSGAGGGHHLLGRGHPQRAAG